MNLGWLTGWTDGRTDRRKPEDKPLIIGKQKTDIQTDR